MRFDDVLEEIGGYGLFQQYVFYLTCPIYLVTAFYLLNPVFLLGTPDHRCAIPGYENDTYAVQSAYHRQLINLTIPSSTANEDGYDRCHVIMSAHVHGVDNTSHPIYVHYNETKTQVSCDKWVYDKSVFKDTFVTKVDLVCDKAVLSATAGMTLYLGMLVGSIVSGILADRYGRKIAMYVSLVLMFGSAVAISFADNYYVFACLQFVLGASSVAAFMPAYIISLEVTSPTKRMWPGVVTNLPFSLGLLIYAAIAYGFRSSMFPTNLTTALLSAVLLSYWWLMPESPRWLLSKGRVQEAESIVRWAARWNKTQIPASLTDDKTSTADRDKSDSCLKLFSTRTVFFRTLLICFDWTTTSFVYYGITLDIGNLHGNLYLNFGLGALVEFPAYIMVIALIDRTGRRLLFIITMGTAGVACLALLFVTQYANDLEALAITLAMIGRLGVTAGFAVLYVHSAELFPTVLRNAGMGIASLCARLGTMVSPYIVTWGEMIGEKYGRILPLSLFGGMAIASAIFTTLLPETLNKNLPETFEDSKRFGKKADVTATV